MFPVFLLFLTSLVGGSYLYWRNQDNVDTKIYDRYEFRVDSSGDSSLALGTVPIANTEGGMIPFVAVSTGTSCPSGYTYNSATGMCEKQTTGIIRFGCFRPNEYWYINGWYTSGWGVCVSYTPPTCPSGFYYSGERVISTCIAGAICPPGTTLNAYYSRCISSITSTNCPSGFFYDSSFGRCVTWVSCPPGYSYYDYSTGKCRTSPICPTGYYFGYWDYICFRDVDFIYGTITLQEPPERHSSAIRMAFR